MINDTVLYLKPHLLVNTRYQAPLYVMERDDDCGPRVEDTSSVSSDDGKPLLKKAKSAHYDDSSALHDGKRSRVQSVLGSGYK